MHRVRRRDFLKASAAIAATAATGSALVGAPGAARAAPSARVRTASVKTGVRQLRLVTSWPDDIAGVGGSAARLARRIETLTGGRYRVHVETGRAGGLAAVTAGVADFAHVVHEPSDLHGGFAFFAGLPGYTGLAAHDFDAWIAVGGGQDLWDDLAAEFGFKPLFAGHTGRSAGLWSAGPIDGLAAISGKRIAAGGLLRDVVRGMGAEPVTIDAGRLPAMLREGEVFATEGIGTEAGLALGLAPVTKVISAPGLVPRGSAVTLAVRLPVWERMSDADQAIVSACAAEEVRVTLAEARALKRTLRRVLVENHAIGFGRLPQGFLGVRNSVSEAVVAHVAASDARAARINASYMAFRHAVAGAPVASVS